MQQQLQPGQPKVFTNMWKEEWLNGCFNDGEACFLSTFCPCVQFAKNYVATNHRKPGQRPAEAVGANSLLTCGVCGVYLAGAYFCQNLSMGLCGCFARGQMREKFGIQAGDCADPCSDCLIHTFCWCCALSQEWRELNYRFDQPMMISVPGQLVQQSPPVMVAQPMYAQPQPQVVMLEMQPQPVYVQQGQPMYVQQQPMYVQQGQPQYVQQQPQYAQVPPQYTQQGQPQAYYSQQPMQR